MPRFGHRTRSLPCITPLIAGLLCSLTVAAPLAGAATAAPSATPAAAATGKVQRTWTLQRDANGSLHVVRFSTTAPAGAAALQRAGASGVELDTRVTASGDPYESQQWGLAKGGFVSAWSTGSGAGVTVAVVDTGVRKTHQDLAGAVLPGVDLVTGSGDGSNDQNGHGTHVAGIIAARRNGVGGAGGAQGAKILPIRVLDANGSGYTSDVAEGIIYAADHGARVVNLSLGGPDPSAAMQTAIQYANSKGAVVLAAAGNNAQTGNPTMYPAAYPEAIAVAATDTANNRASFSNYGSYVDIAAPGVNILSAWGSGDSQYAWASGTSMATPFAASVAALIVARTPSLSASQVAARIKATATDIGAGGVDTSFGYGLINASLAVQGGTDGKGYWTVGANGRVRQFGAAKHYGDLVGAWLYAPVVAATVTKTGKGYWLTTADGRVFAFGDAKWFHDMGGKPLWSPIVAMAPTPSGKGYWLLGKDGGVFSFGDAVFRGSTGGMKLRSPVVDITPTTTGRGYWFVAADGGVFSFGDAVFRGSAGALQLWQPIVSMTASASGKGYWLVASDGGIFSYGVPFRGSLAATPNASSYGKGVRIRALASGKGYYILTSSGAVLPFGSAQRFQGTQSLGASAIDMMVMT
jgi:type VII secretion-associated serine protease mycosin